MLAICIRVLGLLKCLLAPPRVRRLLRVVMLCFLICRRRLPLKRMVVTRGMRRLLKLDLKGSRVTLISWTVTRLVVDLRKRRNILLRYMVLVLMRLGTIPKICRLLT